MRQYTREEIELIRELGELRDAFTLSDKSEENKARGERIREILDQLGLAQGRPKREGYRKPLVVNR